MIFSSFDLDLDLITFILKLDLDMYLCTKNQVPRSKGSTSQPEQTHTDRQT